MSDRLRSGVLVTALLRRVNDAGGMAMVRAKGDGDAGAILIIVCEKANNFKILERQIGPSGTAALVTVAAESNDNSTDIDAYWQRRRSRDPDLWVIELDIPEAERFAAETIAMG